MFQQAQFAPTVQQASRPTAKPKPVFPLDWIPSTRPSVICFLPMQSHSTVACLHGAIQPHVEPTCATPVSRLFKIVTKTRDIAKRLNGGRTSPSLNHSSYCQYCRKLCHLEDNGVMCVTTTRQVINKKILSLDYGEFTVDMIIVHAQDSHNGGVLVLVTEYLTRRGNVDSFKW